MPGYEIHEIGLMNGVELNYHLPVGSLDRLRMLTHFQFSGDPHTLKKYLIGTRLDSSHFWFRDGVDEDIKYQLLLRHREARRSLECLPIPGDTANVVTGFMDISMKIHGVEFSLDPIGDRLMLRLIDRVTNQESHRSRIKCYA
jgi:hypothetical protein